MVRPLAALLLLSAAAGLRAADPPTFATDVQPLLKQYCADCHRAKRVKGDVRLDTFEALMAPGKRPNVVPGDPPRGRPRLVLTARRRHPSRPGPS